MAKAFQIKISMLYWFQLLFCDDCDRGYHMRCMGWKRKRAPKGDWYCEECALVA